MIPSFTEIGLLPPGIHAATWQEIDSRFGTTPHRRLLLNGLRRALTDLAAVGCRRAWLDGSFVTATEVPHDFDACWDAANVNLDFLDPIFLTFANRCAAQKARFGGELFPADTGAGLGQTFLDFFQSDKQTGYPKGIIEIALHTLRTTYREEG